MVKHRIIFLIEFRKDTNFIVYFVLSYLLINHIIANKITKKTRRPINN